LGFLAMTLGRLQADAVVNPPPWPCVCPHIDLVEAEDLVAQPCRKAPTEGGSTQDDHPRENQDQQAVLIADLDRDLDLLLLHAFHLAGFRMEPVSNSGPLTR
jgi:hypothetical protein